MTCAICGNPVESTTRLSPDIQTLSFYESLCVACATDMIAEPSCLMALTIEADFRLTLLEHVTAIAEDIAALAG